MFRIGQGFDVHAFAEGRPLMLGGVKIPFKLGLLGHSDADVLVHAIMDAILGALALGDIGIWFPDNDKNYKNADSLQLLLKIMTDQRFAGWKVVNLDSVIITENPKLMPFIPGMRQNIAKNIGTGIDSISVKATTTEKLGFCGRGEGIAASAIVLLSNTPC